MAQRKDRSLEVRKVGSSKEVREAAVSARQRLSNPELEAYALVL